MKLYMNENNIRFINSGLVSKVLYCMWNSEYMKNDGWKKKKKVIQNLMKMTPVWLFGAMGAWQTRLRQLAVTRL